MVYPKPEPENALARIPNRGHLDDFAEDAWKAAEHSVPASEWERAFERAAQVEYFYIGALWARQYIEHQETQWRE